MAQNTGTSHSSSERNGYRNVKRHYAGTILSCQFHNSQNGPEGETFWDSFVHCYTFSGPESGGVYYCRRISFCMHQSFQSADEVYNAWVEDHNNNSFDICVLQCLFYGWTCSCKILEVQNNRRGLNSGRIHGSTIDSSHHGIFLNDPDDNTEQPDGRSGKITSLSCGYQNTGA